MPSREDRKRHIRCQWYNEHGHPRPKPDGHVGCTYGPNCHFSHPNDSSWATAQPTQKPQAKWYENGIRPPTPDPPRSRSRRELPPSNGRGDRRGATPPWVDSETSKTSNRDNERPSTSGSGAAVVASTSRAQPSDMHAREHRTRFEEQAPSSYSTPTFTTPEVDASKTTMPGWKLQSSPWGGTSTSNPWVGGSTNVSGGWGSANDNAEGTSNDSQWGAGTSWEDVGISVQDNAFKSPTLGAETRPDTITRRNMPQTSSSSKRVGTISTPLTADAQTPKDNDVDERGDEIIGEIDGCRKTIAPSFKKRKSYDGRPDGADTPYSPPITAASALPASACHNSASGVTPVSGNHTSRPSVHSSKQTRPPLSALPLQLGAATGDTPRLANEVGILPMGQTSQPPSTLGSSLVSGRKTIKLKDKDTAPAILSEEERTALWPRRLDLILEAMTARKECRKHVDNRASFEQMLAKTSPQLSQQLRAKLTQSLQEENSKLDLQKGRAIQAVRDLEALDFWPAHRVKPPSKDEEEVATGDSSLTQSLRSRMDVMDASIMQLEKQLQDLQARASSEHVSAAGEPAAHSPMLVDQIMDDLQEADGTRSEQPANKTVSKKLRKLKEDLDDMQNRLESMEGIVSEDEVHQALETELDKRLDGLREELRTAIAKRKAKVDKLKTAQKELYDKIGRLVDDTTSTWVKFEEGRKGTEEAIAKCQLDVQELTRRYTIEVQNLTRLDTQRQNDLLQIGKMRQQVQALSDQSIPPPSLPSLDEIAAEVVRRGFDILKEELLEHHKTQMGGISDIIREKFDALDKFEESLVNIRQIPAISAQIDALTSSEGKGR